MMKTKHLYIHVPFCKTICSYCDFCHRVYQKDLVSKWLYTIKKEINDKCEGEYETIYIGGGTPTSLALNELEQLLALIKPYTNNVIEYTIEVNPESLELDKVLLFKKYGINRISMGVQSSDDSLLKLMNRRHSFNDVKDKIALLKANGLDNISIDLIYSLPSQTMDILNKTIDDFLLLDIPHVSLYSLTIEENTTFGKLSYKSLDIDLEADMYELICNRLIDNNYIHYEVSNFCKQGYESKHNIGYWNYDDFLGISIGASSKVGNRRWTNTTSFDDYFIDFNNKSEDLVLSENDLEFENIMMSLRMKDGIDIESFNKKYHTDILQKYKNGIDSDNIVISDGKIKCLNLEILNNTLVKFMD